MSAVSVIVPSKVCPLSQRDPKKSRARNQLRALLKGPSRACEDQVRASCITTTPSSLTFSPKGEKEPKAKGLTTLQSRQYLGIPQPLS